MDIEKMVYVGVKMTCQHLSDNELVALSLAVEAEYGNLGGVAGYEKAKGLFTEMNGTKMHYNTLIAFRQVVDERLAAAVAEEGEA